MESHCSISAYNGQAWTIYSWSVCTAGKRIQLRSHELKAKTGIKARLDLIFGDPAAGFMPESRACPAYLV